MPLSFESTFVQDPRTGLCKLVCGQNSVFFYTYLMYRTNATRMLKTRQRFCFFLLQGSQNMQAVLWTCCKSLRTEVDWQKGGHRSLATHKPSRWSQGDDGIHRADGPLCTGHSLGAYCLYSSCSVFFNLLKRESGSAHQVSKVMLEVHGLWASDLPSDSPPCTPRTSSNSSSVDASCPRSGVRCFPRTCLETSIIKRLFLAISKYKLCSRTN